MGVAARERHARVCLKNPQNAHSRDTPTTSRKIVQDINGVRMEDREGDSDDISVDGAVAKATWKYAALEAVEWETVCRFKGRMVKEIPRDMAKAWRKTLEAMAEDAMKVSNERRIYVVAALKMKDALVWRHVQDGNGDMVRWKNW